MSKFAVAALAGGIAVSLVGGCSETVSHKETSTHRGNGSSSTETETIKRSPDGTVTHEKEEVRHR